uniref:Flavin-containing monooxygenase n=1 Tax=Ciona savignyi TaxID=51511 RepID=H2ZM09_CIOSA
MYKNLRTNLPKQVMAFPDFPFDKELPSFLKHSDVQEYLESYCKEFKLEKHIEFNTLVQNVTPLESDNRATKWKVTTYHLLTKQTSHHIFDGVMVCNGHYSVPNE